MEELTTTICGTCGQVIIVWDLRCVICPNCGTKYYGSNIMKTKQRVIELISAKAELSSSDIEVSNDLRDDLDLDSLDLIELLMDLEKEFNVTVPDELTGGITDVQSVIDVVESIIKESATK